MTAPAPRREWTDGKRLLARALVRCRFSPATWSKRFARELAAEEREGSGITERQAAALRRLVAIFRRQIKPHEIDEASLYLLTDAAAQRLRTRAISPVLPEPPAPRVIPVARIALVKRPASPNQLALFERGSV